MSYTKLNIGQTIGIIGGGQLGKMMAQSAQRMGFKVAVLDPDDSCPAKSVAHHFIHAPYNDIDQLMKLGEISDCITYEFENIDGQALEQLADHYYVPQGYETVCILQNRIDEKKAIQAAGAHVVPFVEVNHPDDLQQASSLGFPFILKTSFGGYDGKGQVVVNSEEDFAGCLPMIEDRSCVAEQMIDLAAEISITASAHPDGTIVFFPVQENIHRNQILYKTVVSGQYAFQERAIDEVKKIRNSIYFAGTFTVEFFISSTGELFVNEIAPRPHNSGHYSIEACDFSQFDTHILSVAGWQLPQTVQLLKPAVMYNLLGQDLDVLEDTFPEKPDWHVHLYGKKERKYNRKMGHVTILDLNNDYEATYKENE